MLSALMTENPRSRAMRYFGLPLLALVVPAALIAQQTVQLPARDRALSEKIPVLFTVGREEGEDWEILSGVRAAAFDARDNLYLLDANNFRVLVFDPKGKFIRKIAGHGEGPGELMVPTGMTVMTDGTIVVSDGGRRAFSLFRSDGTFLRNAPYPEHEGVGGRPTVAATSDMWMDGLHAHPRSGVVAQITPLPDRGRGLGAPTGERKVSVRWIDLGATTAPSVNLYQFTLPSITRRVQELPGGGASVTMQPTLWTPANTFDMLPSGGVAVADEVGYRIKVLSAAGKIERVLERAIAPRKGTTHDKETFLKRRRENAQQGGMQRGRNGSVSAAPPPAQALASAEEMMRNATWRDVIPVLRRVSTDPQGRIWVARTPVDFGASGPVDLLRADGTYFGTMSNATLPAAVSRSGRAAFVEFDELGVEHVAVKQLPAAWK
jgi:hypothetical protein